MSPRAAIDWMASRAVANAACRLYPPVGPSTSSSSPATYSPGCDRSSIVSGFTSPNATPPTVTIASFSGRTPATDSGTAFSQRPTSRDGSARRRPAASADGTPSDSSPPDARRDATALADVTPGHKSAVRLTSVTPWCAARRVASNTAVPRRHPRSHSMLPDVCPSTRPDASATVSTTCRNSHFSGACSQPSRTSTPASPARSGVTSTPSSDSSR